MNKELCDCGKIASYWYAPASSSNENRFYCDDCVPRGCSCNNHRYIDVNTYEPPLDKEDLPTEEDLPIKWIEEGKIWCHVDMQGREYPCCEFWYEEEGWEIEDTI